ncbi:MAG: peptide deformylase [Patescibacteria group bacterium]
MLNIITHPNPILRKKAQKAPNPLDPEIQALIPEMVKIMKKSDGVGLAAPQIGQSIRLVVVSHKDGDLVLINPQIIKKSILKDWDEEGCLSVPGKSGEVKRCKKIKVKFVNEKNFPRMFTAIGLLARVIQHEVDHLDGILFIDKARKIRNI